LSVEELCGDASNVSEATVISAPTHLLYLLAEWPAV